MNASFTDRTVQAAAHWYARLQAPDCTSADREAFNRWCSDDPANPAAYAAAQDLAARLARSAAANARLRAMTQEALAAGAAPAAAVRRRRVIGATTALAATIVAAVGVAVLLLRSAPPQDVVVTTAHFVTGDETRQFTLTDGTVVDVDVGTVFDVRFSPWQRELLLQEGRAVFDVAHDSARPFSVTAGGGRVMAVGTRFQVESTATEMVVTLAEGVVTVSGELGHAHRTERLTPGDELSISARDHIWSRRTVDVRAATSWSIGRLMFREVRLVDALRDVNRYADTKVRLADSSLGDLRVSGNFLAGDSQAAVAAFAAVLPLEIAAEGNELAIYRRQREQH